jgi:hypothetical protein
MGVVPQARIEIEPPGKSNRLQPQMSQRKPKKRSTQRRKGNGKNAKENRDI